MSGEESTAAESARRATGAATERDRGSVFARRNARRYSACCAARIRGVRNHRRGPRNGVTSSWPRRRGWQPPPDAGRAHQRCTPPASSHGERAAYVKVDHLEAGALSAEIDAMSGAQSISAASGVRRTTGLPRVGTGAVQRLRATARDAVARLTAPRAGRCRPGRGAGRPHPPSARSLTVSMAKGTGKRGRSCGSKGSAPRRNGCDG